MTTPPIPKPLPILPLPILPWAAFHLLCLWMRTTPDGAAGLLGWPDRRAAPEGWDAWEV